MKRIVRLDSMLNVLILAGAMLLASPAIAATVTHGSFVLTVADGNARTVGKVIPEQGDSADKMEVIKAPEVIDPEAEDSEVLSASEVQFHEEDIQDVRAPEVRDPEVEVNTPDIQEPDIHEPDIEINVPEMQTPEIPSVPNIPEVDSPDT